MDPALRAALADEYQRSQDARAQSSVLRLSAAAAISDARRAMSRVGERRRRHGVSVRRTGSPAIPWFELQGRLGGEVVVARWESGALEGDAALLAVANAVVAVGDAFPLGPTNPVLPASLDGPAVAVLLTLARACDAVTEVQLGRS